MKDRQQAHAAADLLDGCPQYDHGVRGCHVLHGIERYFDLSWTPLCFHDPQRQADTNQRMTNACDDRLQFVQDVLRHVLVAVAQEPRHLAVLAAVCNPTDRFEDQ